MLNKLKRLYRKLFKKGFDETPPNNLGEDQFTTMTLTPTSTLHRFRITAVDGKMEIEAVCTHDFRRRKRREMPIIRYTCKTCGYFKDEEI